MRARSLPLALVLATLGLAASARAQSASPFPPAPTFGAAPSAPTVAPAAAAPTPAKPLAAASPAPAPSVAPMPTPGTPSTAAQRPLGPQGQRTDPAGKTGISPVTLKLLKGNAAFAARDFAGAVAVYRDALQDDPQNALGHYLLGEAQLASGNLAEADGTWQNALRFTATDDVLAAKVLFCVADLRERQGKAAEAKAAWDAYARFLTDNAKVKGQPATAAERKRAIDGYAELAAKSGVVKQRIEQRLKLNGAPPPDETPAAPAPKSPKKKK